MEPQDWKGSPCSWVRLLPFCTLTGLFILIIQNSLKEQLTSTFSFLVLLLIHAGSCRCSVCSPGIHMEVTETCQIYQQLLISGSSLIMIFGEADDNNRRKMWNSVIWKWLEWRLFCTVWCWNVRNDWGQIYNSSSLASVFHLWATNAKNTFKKITSQLTKSSEYSVSNII